jgi:hypothetical protein
MSRVPPSVNAIIVPGRCISPCFDKGDLVTLEEVDFQSGSVQAKARYFAQVAQQSSLPMQATSAGPVPTQLHLPSTPSHGLNSNALALPFQEPNDDNDGEATLEPPDGHCIPAYAPDKKVRVVLTFWLGFRV